MSLDAFLRLGETVTLGTHRFTAEEIKTFARAYDPQLFHTEERAAEQSVFGGLCASGWHTCAMWMRYNLQAMERDALPWEGPEKQPAFGPSPGFSNLKWLKPVYAGDEITFTRRAVSHRAQASRPGWLVVALVAEAFNGSGEKVLEFDNAVLLNVS